MAEKLERSGMKKVYIDKRVCPDGICGSVEVLMKDGEENYGSQA